VPSILWFQPVTSWPVLHWPRNQIFFFLFVYFKSSYQVCLCKLNRIHLFFLDKPYLQDLRLLPLLSIFIWTIFFSWSVRLKTGHSKAWSEWNDYLMCPTVCQSCIRKVLSWYFSKSWKLLALLWTESRLGGVRAFSTLLPHLPANHEGVND